MTALRMSDRGRALLTQREGVRLRAYQDSVGIWTVGVGHTSAAGDPHVTPGLELTRAQVDEVFKRDLGQYERGVSEAVKVPLAQHEFDALVSLCFNIGVGAFGRSSLVRALNKSDRRGAADAFLMWDKAAGRVIPGLTKRRHAERAQFLTPYTATAAKPAAKAARDTAIVVAPTGGAAAAAKSSGLGWPETLGLAFGVAVLVTVALVIWHRRHSP